MNKCKASTMMLIYGIIILVLSIALFICAVVMKRIDGIISSGIGLLISSLFFFAAYKFKKYDI